MTQQAQIGKSSFVAERAISNLRRSTENIFFNFDILNVQLFLKGTKCETIISQPLFTSLKNSPGHDSESDSTSASHLLWARCSSP